MTTKAIRRELFSDGKQYATVFNPFSCRRKAEVGRCQEPAEYRIQVSAGGGCAMWFTACGEHAQEAIANGKASDCRPTRVAK